MTTATEFNTVGTFRVGEVICGFERRPHDYVSQRPCLEPFDTPFPWLRHQSHLPGGQVVPVIDLRQLVQIKIFGDGESQERGSLVVAQINSQLVGMLVAEPCFDRIPKSPRGIWLVPTPWDEVVKWVGEVGERAVYILNLEQLVHISPLPPRPNGEEN